MEPVRTAVIPAAGLGTRFLPASKAVPKELVPLVDRPALQWVVEEAVAAGDDHVLRTELLRRYLHCYAPTMPGHFAEWAGERGAARRGAGATR